MRQRVTGRAALVIGLMIGASVGAGRVLAAPIGAAESAVMSGIAVQAPTTTERAAGPAAAPGSVSHKPDIPDDLVPDRASPAEATAPTRERLRESGDKLRESSDKPRAPGRVAALSASTIPVEEDPKVDAVDVVEAVFRSTADAVPWLHLVPSPGADRRRARQAAERESALENAARFDADDRSARDALSRTARLGDGSDAAPMPLLSREMVLFAKELIDNPLAWMAGFLVALIGITLAFVRSRADPAD